MTQDHAHHSDAVDAVVVHRRPVLAWAGLCVLGALLLFTIVGAGRTVASGKGGASQLMALDVEAGDVSAQSARDVAVALSDAAADSDKEAHATFGGRPIRQVGEMTMLVTAYSPDEKSCGIWADGVTASGYSVWTNGMKMVAADTDVLPFGSIVSIPGYDEGRPVPVLDRGGKIKGQRLDVLYPNHETARQWGARDLTVTVWEYAD